jgi:hypothetical protein
MTSSAVHTTHASMNASAHRMVVCPKTRSSMVRLCRVVSVMSERHVGTEPVYATLSPEARFLKPTKG